MNIVGLLPGGLPSFPDNSYRPAPVTNHRPSGRGPNRKEEAVSGRRQATAVVEANGRKHMSQAEADERRDREVHVPPPEMAVPPSWLGKKYHKEYCRIGEILRSAGLYSELDQDVLAQYFVSRDRWEKADKKAGAAIRKNDEKLAKEWTSIQATYFKQTRQCAMAMGLDVTSRCRIVVPQALVNAAKATDGSGEDEFTRMLQARQAAALQKAE